MNIHVWCVYVHTQAHAHVHTHTHIITAHFYLQLHGILVTTELKYNSKALTRNDKQNNDSIQNLPLYADCFTFLRSLWASINQPLSKHLTQAKISTTKFHANRMDIQLNGNVWTYAAEGRETPSEIMEWVNPWSFHLNTVQHSGLWKKY